MLVHGVLRTQQHTEPCTELFTTGKYSQSIWSALVQPGDPRVDKMTGMFPSRNITLDLMLLELFRRLVNASPATPFVTSAHSDQQAILKSPEPCIPDT